MKKVIILIVIAVILFGAGVSFIIGSNSSTGDMHSTKEDVMINPDTINRFEFQRSGSSMNSLYKLTFEGDRITIEKRDGNRGKIHSKKYNISYDMRKEVEEIIASSGMRLWSKDFPINDEVVLDGETTYVVVAFADGTNISFDSSHEIPGGGWDAVYDALKRLESVCVK